jgi:hypothetical protein
LLVMIEYVQPATQIVGAATSIGTLAVAVLVWLKVGTVASEVKTVVAKSEEIHGATAEILKQTNGIMERSEAKTEIIAHAAGVQEGLTQHLGEAAAAQAVAVSEAAAAAAALVLETAAKKAAEALAAAATIAAARIVEEKK